MDRCRPDTLRVHIFFLNIFSFLELIIPPKASLVVRSLRIIFRPLKCINVMPSTSYIFYLFRCQAAAPIPDRLFAGVRKCSHLHDFRVRSFCNHGPLVIQWANL